jgi:hypothetical protein
MLTAIIDLVFRLSKSMWIEAKETFDLILCGVWVWGLKFNPAS